MQAELERTVEEWYALLHKTLGKISINVQTLPIAPLFICRTSDTFLVFRAAASAIAKSLLLFGLIWSNVRCL